ncbi:MAG: DUF3604 domain-containing protein [Gammaproteobacteria bacterium]|nr:DUF3604 domain-containing protein [Gammaproteobacteria bacterium]
MMRFVSLLLSSCFAVSALAQTESPKRLLWGDTHLHTAYSFDAFLSQNSTADPDTAYRWAKGLPVVHPYHRARVQIKTPLDFLVVSDHAELMGVIRAITNDTAELEEVGFFADLKRRFSTYMLLDAIENRTGRKIFTSILPTKPSIPDAVDPVVDPANTLDTNRFGDTTKTETTAWNEIVAAAERHNDPGKFTSLIGWEWSSIPTGANLHRVVFTPDGADTAKQFLPYGSDQSQYPEDLWNWLEQTSERTVARFMAMPHNSNISKGYMYRDTTLRGEPIGPAYAAQRMRWEPISEITQIKGDSETHPDLSPNDEFADFETYRFYIQQIPEEYVARAADYARPALLTGLGLQHSVGANPYKFGFIGSTDAHTGLASAEEDNFWGKMARDSTPETKRSQPVGERQNAANGWNMGAQGLAAVWARDNTRDEIYAAFKRKETYATTGPRIAVRMFASWEFSEEDLQAEDLAEVGYAKGVPMGGDLMPQDAAGVPQFLIQAAKDPSGANLDRAQIIKGWVDANGDTHEKIYNVAWSGERQVSADGNLPEVGNTVNLETGTYTNTIGSPALSVVWSDPDFDATQAAFYYLRVLEIPTPRHSVLDALALQADLPQEGPATIQERAYTSPVWYTPQ